MLETIVQGVLLGGLYTLFALGQSLMFGVMRLTSTAQGDFIILGAFAVIAGVSLHGRCHALARGARGAAGGLRFRLRAAALRAQRHARQGPAAFAGRHFRPVDRHSEPAARTVLGRSACHRDRRAPLARHCAGRCDVARRAAARRAGHRGRCDGRSAVALCAHGAGPIVSRGVRRPRDRRTHGAEREEGLRACHCDRLRADRHRRCAAGHANNRLAFTTGRCCCCSPSRP